MTLDLDLDLRVTCSSETWLVWCVTLFVLWPAHVGQEVGILLSLHTLAFPLSHLLLTRPETPACSFCFATAVSAQQKARDKKIKEKEEKRKSWVYVGEKTPKQDPIADRKQRQNQNRKAYAE